MDHRTRYSPLFIGMIKNCCFAFSFFLLLLSGTTGLYAQGDSTVVEEVAPIDETQAIRRIEQVARDLVEISSELNRENRLVIINNDYESFRQQLERYVQVSTDQLNGAGINRLQDFILILERLDERLNGWQAEVVAMGEKISGFQKMVDTAIIEMDSIASNKNLLNELYKDHMYNVQEQLKSTRDLLNARQEEILTLQINLSEDDVSVLKILNMVKDYRSRYWDRLLARDTTSLRFDTNSETRIRDTVWRIFSFFPDNPFNTFFFIIILTGIFLLLRFIKSRDSEKEFKVLYATPIATACMLGFLLFPVVFPPTTTLIYDFMLVLAYRPFLFILLHPPFREQYIAYFVFFISFLVIRCSSFYIPLVPGWLVAVIYMGGAAIFLLFLFNKRQFRIFNPRWKIATGLLWLLKSVIVISLVLYFFDRKFLAKIFIESTGDTIALGMVILYIGFWMDHLIDFLKTRPYFKRVHTSDSKIAWDKWRNFVRLILLIIYIVAFAHYFHVDDYIAEAVSDFLTAERSVGSLTFDWGGILLFVSVLFITSKLAGWVKFFTTGKAIYGSQKKTGTIAAMVRFGIILAGFLMALFVSGIPLDKITIILGALSVGLGFGLQNIVNNLVSGIILIFERPIQVGDMVNVKTYMGVVKDIGIRASVVKTFDGAEVIIPNGHLISEEVINWTLSDQHRRVEVLVGVAYGSDVEKVKEVLTEIVSDFKGILKLPKPMVLFQEFGDSSLNFSLRFWVSDIDDWLIIKSDITTSVYHALQKAKIEIPFPQRDLHVRSMSVDDLKKAMATTSSKK